MAYTILHDIVSAYISNILSPQASPLCTLLFLSTKHQFPKRAMSPLANAYLHMAVPPCLSE